MINYESLADVNKTLFSQIEIAVSKVVRSGWYILGNEVSSFEAEFASHMGVKHCIGVANGLDALTLSLRALDLPEKSEVLVAANTYIATILAIIQSGHTPILIEPDHETYNLDADLVESHINSNTRAICITHLYGKPCNMDKIMYLVKKYNLKLVEDCAQSHEACYDGKLTGTFGDAGCFSFYPTKNLGAIGDAGAILTNDSDLADKLLHLRNYGSKQKYINRYIGVNSRLDDIQAAVLRIKLPFLKELTEHKIRLANIYFENLPRDIILPARNQKEFDVFHIFAIRTAKRDELKAFLLAHDVKTEVHYPVPPHHQEAMEGILSGSFPISEEIHRTELSLPISYATTEEQVRRVCELVTLFFNQSELP